MEYTKQIGAAIGLTITVGTIGYAIMQDRHERALLASGKCQAVAESLYTPAPTAHTSCYGPTESRRCSTYFTQPDPYFRTLWRCADPETSGALVEFWRRSTEVFAR
jgi:hypothetical protein